MGDYNSWQGIHAEVLRRIRERVWKPGEPIPNEADLATEFGCARTTVNRALRVLAADGILERKRRSGTRVALHPVAKTVIDIQVIRREIEAKGGAYSYRLLTRRVSKPPAGLREKLGITEAEDWLHLLALHVTDDTPYALEDRWISLTTVPMAKQVDFHAHSANEWLLEHVPYTDAALSIRAASADDLAQRHLVVSADAPILQLERVTRLGAALVTAVTLSFPPGHQIVSSAGSA